MTDVLVGCCVQCDAVGMARSCDTTHDYENTKFKAKAERHNLRVETWSAEKAQSAPWLCEHILEHTVLGACKRCGE